MNNELKLVLKQPTVADVSDPPSSSSSKHD